MAGKQRTGADGTVRFTVLGPVRAWREGVEVELGSPTRRALLAILLVNAGQPVVISELVNALWGQEPPDGAVNIIQRHVGLLRRLIDPSLSTRTAGDLLVRGSGGYRLVVDETMLDLLEFRALVASAEQAATAGEATESYVRALALRRGPVAAGIAELTRANPLFGSVEREYALAAQAAAETALRAGTPERVAAVLADVAQHAPYDEALQARLIQVLTASGRQANAIEVYRSVRDRLAEDLGIDPGPELRAVYDNITAAAPPPAVPPAQPRRRGPAQLPADLPIFTGRDAELARLAGLVESPTGDGLPETVVTVVSGMAGVGKSTLAVRLAHDVAPRFPDGQLYLNLRGFDQARAEVEAKDAIRQLLETQGIAPDRIPASPIAAADLYRGMLQGRRMLILLDNARDAEQVRPLLPNGPGSMVIITSRNRLFGLVTSTGAHFLPLDVLSPAESRRFLAARLGADRLANEPIAVDELIARSGGLPLALAIVAARAAIRPGFPLAAIAEELRIDGGLDAFADVDPATDTRSVFSWSLRAVTPSAGHLFLLLGLHPGPDFAAPVAAALTGMSVRNARLVLNELSYAHLVAEHVPGRFTQHDLLRAYAAELAADEDAELVREATVRMLDHYLHSANAAVRAISPHRAGPALPPPHQGANVAEFADGQQANAWLSAERSVLVALIEMAARCGFDAQAWQLATVLDRILDRQGRWQDQSVIQPIALAAARRVDAREGVASALRAIGFTQHRLGQQRQGRENLERALALFTELDNAPGMAESHRLLAFQANANGDHDTALAHYESAIDSYRRIEDEASQAAVYNEVGWTHILRGDYQLALTRCQEALILHTKLDDDAGAAADWDSLGYAHHHLGQYHEAIACYDTAVRLYQHVGDRALEADTLRHIGEAELALGKRAESRETVARAVAILEDLGHPDAAKIRARCTELNAER